MLKMLGAACVIFSASAVGFGFSGNVRRQCAQLTALIEALTYLKSEMLYRCRKRWVCLRSIRRTRRSEDFSPRRRKSLRKAAC